MKKSVLFIGIGIFVLGLLSIFLSNSRGGTIETSKPTVPFLYGTNPAPWIFLSFIGFIITIVGAVLKGKEKQISDNI